MCEEVTSIVWFATFTAARPGSPRLVIAPEAYLGVAEGCAGQAVTVPLAAPGPAVHKIHPWLHELLVSAGLSCPLFRLECVIVVTNVTTWNIYIWSIREFSVDNIGGTNQLWRFRLLLEWFQDANISFYDGESDVLFGVLSSDWLADFQKNKDRIWS